MAARSSSKCRASLTKKPIISLKLPPNSRKPTAASHISKRRTFRQMPPSKPPRSIHQSSLSMPRVLLPLKKHHIPKIQRPYLAARRLSRSPTLPQLPLNLPSKPQQRNSHRPQPCRPPRNPLQRRQRQLPLRSQARPPSLRPLRRQHQPWPLQAGPSAFLSDNKNHERYSILSVCLVK